MRAARRRAKTLPGCDPGARARAREGRSSGAGWPVGPTRGSQAASRPESCPGRRSTGCASVDRPPVLRLGAAAVLARFGIDLDPVADAAEERHVDDVAVLELRGLEHLARRVAP